MALNKEDNEIKIMFTGDFCPINRVGILAESGNYQQVLDGIISEFNCNDLNIIDLECPLTHSDAARPKTGPHQKANPKCIDLLKYFGTGLAAMANNHMLDYGSEGVEETLQLLKEKNIATVGIGKSPEEAAAAFSITLKGRRIAIFNMADHEFLTDSDGDYYCNPINEVECYYALLRAKQEYDFIAVIVHAGNEFYELPSPRIKRLYRFIIDAGADAVISHHTHVFSGYEIYKSKPIFYGLGNFVYDWPGKVNAPWNRGYIIRLIISDTIEFELIPILQCNFEATVTIMNESEKQVFKREIDRLNQIIGDDLLLAEAFTKYCETVFPMYDAFIEPYFGKIVTALRKRGFFPKILNRRKRLYLLNLIRCESHREVLLRMLKKNE